MIKIKKVEKVENPDINFQGLEVEIEVDGKICKECFLGYDYWMEKVNGEERFISRLRDNNLKTPEQIQKIFDDDQKIKTNKKTTISKFNDEVIT